MVVLSYEQPYVPGEHAKAFIVNCATSATENEENMVYMLRSPRGSCFRTHGRDGLVRSGSVLGLTQLLFEASGLAHGCVSLKWRGINSCLRSSIAPKVLTAMTASFKYISYGAIYLWRSA